MLNKCILCSLLFALVTPSNKAQQVTGNLEGRIVESEEHPLDAVTVVVSGPSLQGNRGTTSDETGFFRVLALPPGSYGVKITHVAYHEVIYTDVVISLGKTMTLGEVHLTLKELIMPEVVVNQTRPLIDPRSTALGGNLEFQTFETLPTERSYQSLLALLPQANTSYLGDPVNIAGSTGLENMFFIDGINVTDAYQGASATNLPYNFVKEIEVRTGGYEAEFGRAGGGLVNVITRSGSNDFRGQAFGFFTNNDFAGTPSRGVVELDLRSYSSYDLGLSLGGPLMTDKIWFFAAYNPTVKQEVIRIQDLGDYTDKKTASLFAAKIDWRATENTSVTFSTFGDPSVHHAVAPQEEGLLFGTPGGLANIDPFLLSIEEGGINLALSARHTVGSSFLLEASLSRFDGKNKRQMETAVGRSEPLIIGMDNGVWSGGGFPNENSSERTTGRITGTWFFRDHLLKAGAEYEDNRTKVFWLMSNPGFTLRYSDSLFVAIYVVEDYEVENRAPSFFVQDAWKVSERLTLNIGLRWDGQYLIGADGSVAQGISNEFQPRAGFVFLPGEAGMQKIFGSYGRFYQQLPTFLPAQNYSEWLNGIIVFKRDPRINPAQGDTTLKLIIAKAPVDNGLKGQYFDEFVLGYEHSLSDQFKLGIRGTYRKLGDVIEDALDPSGGAYEAVLGNPGRGRLSFLPRLQHDYQALEITLEKSGGQGLSFLASYVLSRTYGSYTGLFDSNTGYANPDHNRIPDMPEQVPGSVGLLPNDRTHIFKVNSSYKFDFGLTVGSTFIWESGTPLSEYGMNSANILARPIFLQDRGTVGRTPSVWDLNVRLTYDLRAKISTVAHPKLILDIFHIGNPRIPVDFDQVHYSSVDQNGNQATPNPYYMKTTQYEPPMTVRLGLEVNF